MKLSEPPIADLKLLTKAIHAIRPEYGANDIRLVWEVHAVLCPRKHGLSEVTACGWEIGEHKDVAHWLTVTEHLTDLAMDSDDATASVRDFLGLIYPL